MQKDEFYYNFLFIQLVISKIGTIHGLTQLSRVKNLILLQVTPFLRRVCEHPISSPSIHRKTHFLCVTSLSLITYLYKYGVKITK